MSMMGKQLQTAEVTLIAHLGTTRVTLRDIVNMRPGDVIVKVGETATRNVSELLTAVASLKPGVQANFHVQRGDRMLELGVTPGLRPRPARALRR